MGFSRKELKRFSKKELITLAKEHDFGFKPLTKMTKVILVENIFKSKGFTDIKSTITKKQKRTQSQAQRDAFKKMIGRKRNKEETIVESREDLITDSNENDLKVPVYTKPEIIETQKIQRGVSKKIPKPRPPVKDAPITTEGDLKTTIKRTDPREIGVEVGLLVETKEIKELVKGLDKGVKGFFEQQLLKREAELKSATSASVGVQSLPTITVKEEEKTDQTKLEDNNRQLKDLTFEREKQKTIITRLKNRINNTPDEIQQLENAKANRTILTAQIKVLNAEHKKLQNELGLNLAGGEDLLRSNVALNELQSLNGM